MDLISREKLIKKFEEVSCPKERNTYLYKLLLKLVVEAPTERPQQEGNYD